MTMSSEPVASDHTAMEPDVQCVFARYEEPWRQRLLALRALMFVAAERAAVGGLAETLKWGQPAYRPLRTGVGTTVRIDVVPGGEGDCGLFFHCHTTLVEQFREFYGHDVTFLGNRLMLVPGSGDVETSIVVQCAAMAFSYHRDKARALRG